MEKIAEEEEEETQKNSSWNEKKRRKEVSLSCMLNTELSAVLAVIRRPHDPVSAASLLSQEDNFDSPVLHSLKSLRALIFNPQQDWRSIDPSVYIIPFLDVIQGDDIPATATNVALSAISKILKLQIFDDKTPGAKETMNLIVNGITSCRLERTDTATEDAVMMRILQALTAIIKHKASILLTDQAVCTIVNACFQVVQHSSNRADLLQRGAKYTMRELIEAIFARLQDIEVRNEEDSDTDNDDIDIGNCIDSGYGVRCVIDIFHFLCSLLNVAEVVETEGGIGAGRTHDGHVQIFGLILISSAVELSGDAIGKHPKLLRMIQDDLFHHLIYYGGSSTPLVLSMICSTVLNIYHSLRRYIRVQLEAFFVYVMLKAAGPGSSSQLQEVALEGIINFCRQPTFIVEMYVNYDCDPICRNVFEEIGNLLCKLSFPGSSPLSYVQIQAFEGLLIVVHNIADNIDREDDPTPSGPYPVLLNEYRPFWEEKTNLDFESWIDHIRLRKAQKKKILISGDHFNRDEKKGLEYLKLSNLVSEPADPKAYAFFYRYTPGLDKKVIGDFLGDPDDFHVQVLREFTGTFNFSGMILDTALRTYLASFRLPGESQKIQRILEAFSEAFYDQQTSDIFATKDALFILCYSLMMLNTDAHNPQVKKKMTEDEFIRNNRAINAGQDLPREYLSEMFQSIATNAITLEYISGPPSAASNAASVRAALEMNPARWIELMNRSRVTQSFIQTDFDRRIGRDMFVCIAGPSLAAICSFFEHADDDEMLHECIGGLISVARIAQYDLEDILDELLATFSKFTTLLNPYASAEETLFAFSHDMKPRMATLAVFTIANNFGDAIRAGWRNIVDCLLKLKRLKLLPQSVTEFDDLFASSSNGQGHRRNESALSPCNDLKLGSRRSTGMINKFSHFFSLETLDESVALGMNEFEQNLKVIKQCRIRSIFNNSCNLTDEALLNFGRSLIFAAGGKGQKFSTPIEEEETVGFGWDMIVALSMINIDRFQNFWPFFHDNLLAVAQFPLFSPVPFAEKGILGLFKICAKLLSSFRPDRFPEEYIFKSINLMWKLDKEILDTCCEFITKSVSNILSEYAANLQTSLGWKTSLQLLSMAGRLPDTYDLGVDSLIQLMSESSNITRVNYAYCIDCAFGFIALKNSPLEKNLKILDLLADSVNLLIQWYREFSDPGSCFSVSSNTSTSSLEDNSRGFGSSNYSMNLFIKLGEAFRKTSLARREEIRNHSITSLQKAFTLAEDLDFSPQNIINCFNLVIFAMVDDLHEKMVEYSRREGAEKEMRSMEGTLKIAMELLTEAYLQFLKPIGTSPGFRTFWLGVLRRMDTCMKADLGVFGETRLQEIIPELLKKLITRMKEEEILVKKETDDDLWDITYIQIQWIAPALKDELFPEEL
ncbi:ARF guanine-nucleotide exchange factor GNL2 [Euphorbia lathyris]|uniref:ARF guanine-nucleotide exchange factor GNL2 n=1 Tax=Euphorbia lathyris TaxID=212925 RepID=UPI003313BB26